MHIIIVVCCMIALLFKQQSKTKKRNISDKVSEALVYTYHHLQ